MRIVWFKVEVVQEDIHPDMDLIQDSRFNSFICPTLGNLDIGQLLEIIVVASLW